MNEPAPGLRANLRDLLQTIPSSATAGASEKARLIFLLCWLHALVLERLRYAPLAFTKVYEFNDSDFAAALQRICAWMDGAAKGRSNLKPELIPWAAIRTSLSQYALGGRVDVDEDQRVLDSFIDHLFQPKSFDVGFQLVQGSGDTNTVAPEGTTIDAYSNWASLLPEIEQPMVLGLPSDAASVVARKQSPYFMLAKHH